MVNWNFMAHECHSEIALDPRLITCSLETHHAGCWHSHHLLQLTTTIPRQILFIGAPDEQSNTSDCPVWGEQITKDHISSRFRHDSNCEEIWSTRDSGTYSPPARCSNWYITWLWVYGLLPRYNPFSKHDIYLLNINRCCRHLSITRSQDSGNHGCVA